MSFFIEVLYWWLNASTKSIINTIKGIEIVK